MGPLGQGLIIPEMLLYADKAIELECRSQAVEYMCGHDVNLIRYLLDQKLRQWQAEDLSCLHSQIAEL